METLKSSNKSPFWVNDQILLTWNLPYDSPLHQALRRPLPGSRRSTPGSLEPVPWTAARPAWRSAGPLVLLRPKPMAQLGASSLSWKNMKRHRWNHHPTVWLGSRCCLSVHFWSPGQTALCQIKGFVRFTSSKCVDDREDKYGVNRGNIYHRNCACFPALQNPFWTNKQTKRLFKSPQTNSFEWEQTLADPGWASKTRGSWTSQVYYGLLWFYWGFPSFPPILGQIHGCTVPWSPVRQAPGLSRCARRSRGSSELYTQTWWPGKAEKVHLRACHFQAVSIITWGWFTLINHQNCGSITIDTTIWYPFSCLSVLYGSIMFYPFSIVFLLGGTTSLIG